MTLNELFPDASRSVERELLKTTIMLRLSLRLPTGSLSCNEPLTPKQIEQTVTTLCACSSELEDVMDQLNMLVGEEFKCVVKIVPRLAQENWSGHDKESNPPGQYVFTVQALNPQAARKETLNRVEETVPMSHPEDFELIVYVNGKIIEEPEALAVTPGR